MFWTPSTVKKVDELGLEVHIKLIHNIERETRSNSSVLSIKRSVGAKTGPALILIFHDILRFFKHLYYAFSLVLISEVSIFPIDQNILTKLNP